MIILLTTSENLQPPFALFAARHWRVPTRSAPPLLRRCCREHHQHPCNSRILLAVEMRAELCCVLPFERVAKSRLESCRPRDNCMAEENMWHAVQEACLKKTSLFQAIPIPQNTDGPCRYQDDKRR